MRARLTPAGRKRAAAARCLELAAHYEHKGVVLLGDGTYAVRERTVADVLLAQLLFAEWHALTCSLRDAHEGRA